MGAKQPVYLSQTPRPHVGLLDERLPAAPNAVQPPAMHAAHGARLHLPHDRLAGPAPGAQLIDNAYLQGSQADIELLNALRTCWPPGNKFSRSTASNSAAQHQA